MVKEHVVRNETEEVGDENVAGQENSDRKTDFLVGEWPDVAVANLKRKFVNKSVSKSVVSK